MKPKKLTGIVLAAALTLAAAVPVAADEYELTETIPANDNTEVTAKVSEVEPGNPTYIIAVPAKIDFGTLYQPQTSAPNTKSVSFEIKATKVDDLSSGSIVAVLMKDTTASSASDPFVITGQDDTNAGKALEYSVIINNDGGESVDISSRSYFPEGYPVYGFTEAGQKTNGQLTLDQAQLYGKTLSEWAGNFTGHIHFYSTIAAPKDYMMSN